MTPQFIADVSLRELNTFHFEARAERYTELHTLEDVRVLGHWLRRHPRPLLVLGGGSNLVLASRIPGVVARICLPGFALDESSAGLAPHEVLVTLGAGEVWHASIQRLLEMGVYGLENLALIPGCVGAAPVQNIGAYGVEVRDHIDSVQVYEWATEELYWLSNADCRFAYRDSLFKQQSERFLITAVRFRLSRIPEPVLTYAPLSTLFAGREEVAPRAVFDAVCSIRRSKLPDPARIGNAGSFFKNPVVSVEQCERLRQLWPGLVCYPEANGFKLAAGWLIDRCGWKGYRAEGVGVHDQQALVLVNQGSGDRDQLEKLAIRIRRSVSERFGVELEVEPRFYP